MMKTAVIIPIYNQEKYLASALDALLAQTCADWVAYCVNDGSTDKSADILGELRSLRCRGLLCFPWGGRFPLVREWFKLRWMAML